MDQVEEIKSKVSIVDIVGEYVALKKAGRHFKANCPFHSEKTPSFVVSPELQIYKCFGCAAGGDVYRFLMDYEKIDFPQALKILADRVGIKLIPLHGHAGYEEKEELYKLNYFVAEFYHYLLFKHTLGKKALAYLEKRGTSEDTAKTFKLGFAPSSSDIAMRYLTGKRGYKIELLEKAGLVYKKENKYFDRFRDRLIFPLKDHFGNVVGFAGRIIENKDEVAKYINTAETLVYKKGSLLFGLDLAKQEIKKTGFAIVVEGEFDCISSWQAGVKNVIAIKGSALTDEQVFLLSRFCPKIVLALDSDLAGDQAARRGIETAQDKGLEVRVAALGSFKDPDEFAQKDPKGWENAVLTSVGVYDFFVDSIFSRFDPETAEGKAKISKQLMPILSNINDEIVKAHYVKMVSEKLDVPEVAVGAQVSKVQNIPRQASNEGFDVQIKSRRQLFEERLLALILQTNPKLLFEDRICNTIKTQGYSRVLTELKKNNETINNENFKAADFSSQLPDELKDIFASLFLVELGIAREESVVAQEIESIFKLLDTLDIKEEMLEAVEKIKNAEKKGDTREVEEYENKLGVLSKKLTESDESTVK